MVQMRLPLHPSTAHRRDEGPTVASRRRIPHNLVLVSAALLLSSAPFLVEGFVPATSLSTSFSQAIDDEVLIITRKLNSVHQGSHGRTDRRGSCRAGGVLRLLPSEPSSLLIAKASKDDSESWSRAPPVDEEDSRSLTGLGVRSRVRSVLKKARGRTGIRNNTDEEKKRTASSVVADAAAIGGLGAVVLDERGTVDVALDFVQPKKNGAQSRSFNGDLYSARNQTNGAYVAPNGEDNGIAVKSVGVNGSSQSKTMPGNNAKKSSPASTYSPPITRLEPNPEDSLVPASSDATSANDSKKVATNEKAGSKPKPAAGTPLTEVDALNADVSAAFSLPAEPLPFTLPTLTPPQRAQLDAGERVQFQSEMKRAGSGFVVMDVKAPEDVIWDCLLDFHSYPQTIPTVRGVTMYTNTHLKDDYRHEKPVAYEDGTFATLKHGVSSVTRAAFTLSKFRLQIAAIHKYRPHPQGDYMVFTLDPACTNIVLKAAKGVWHTQANPDGKGEEYTRVWLLCELKVSRALPSFIVDYAAQRAMPRATTWLKPQVEAAASLWLKKPPADVNGQ